MFGGWLLVHCGGSIRCIKAEIGDENREKGKGLHLEQAPWKTESSKILRRDRGSNLCFRETALVSCGGWLKGLDQR